MSDPTERISQIEERFERLRKGVGFWLGPLLFGLILWTDFPSLSPTAHTLAAVIAWVLVYWTCEPIPMPVTALLGPSLCVVLGVSEAKTLLAHFGDPILFVFIGSFLLARALMIHGLDRRIALNILSLRWVGNSLYRVLFVFGATAAFISLWLSNAATTAMLLPIGIGILSEIHRLLAANGVRTAEVSRLRMSRGLLLLTAYGASAGGLGTPVGTPPNLIGISMIQNLLGIRINFVDWMKMALPMVVVMYLALFFLIVLLHPPEARGLPGMGEYFRTRRRTIGPWSRGEKNALTAFLTAVALWVAPGVLGVILGWESPVLATYQKNMPEGVAAVLAACLLFVLPVDWKKRTFTLSWEEGTQIDWGTILIFGAGIALGSLAFSTGLAETLGRSILAVTGVESLAGITFLSILIAVVVSEATSNTASANMVIPVAISVAKAAEVDPLLPALGACLGASYGFMFPVSTAPNAIVYGSGMVPITSMMKTGILFDVIGLFVIWGGLMLFGVG